MVSNEEDRRNLDLLLQAIPAALPIEMIYSDYSTSPREVRQFETDGDAVIESLYALKHILSSADNCNAEAFREVMRSTRLFENCSDIVEKFMQEEFGCPPTA